jgi:hypothetical protein
VAVAGVEGVRVAARPARAAILQQLDVVARPAVAGRGQPEQRDAQLGVGIRDDGPQVGLAAIPLGDQLEAQEIRGRTRPSGPDR